MGEPRVVTNPRYPHNNGVFKNRYRCIYFLFFKMAMSIGHASLRHLTPFVVAIFTGNAFHVKSMTFMVIFVDNTVPYVYKGHNVLSMNIAPII